MFRRRFNDSTAVGLAIVTSATTPLPSTIVTSTRLLHSQTVDVVTAAAAVVPAVRARKVLNRDSQDYTCVVTDAKSVKPNKRYYLDDGHGNVIATRTCVKGKADGRSNPNKLTFYYAVPNRSATRAAPPAPMENSFLSRCLRCRVSLYGKDIYMYRGEDMFCSPQCRCYYVLNNTSGEEGEAEAIEIIINEAASSSTPNGTTAT